MRKISTVGIIQYGAGNQASIINALESLGVTSLPIVTPNDVGRADKLIIPGRACNESYEST